MYTLLPACHFHLSVPNFIDVAEARSYFAGTMCSFNKGRGSYRPGQGVQLDDANTSVTHVEAMHTDR